MLIQNELRFVYLYFFVAIYIRVKYLLDRYEDVLLDGTERQIDR